MDSLGAALLALSKLILFQIGEVIAVEKRYVYHRHSHVKREMFIIQCPVLCSITSPFPPIK